MANVKNGKNRKKQKSNRKVDFIIVLIILFVSMIHLRGNSKQSNTESIGQNNTTETQSVEENIQQEVDGQLELTMIDVGQADCFFLEQDGKTALIDCGTRSTGRQAVKYLKDLGVKRLDYVFGTHPHEDHMGGMYDIVKNFEIGQIIIPKVYENITTNWYMKLMTELTNGSYDVLYPKLGDIYNLGNASMKVIGPVSEPKDNLNNYSIVLKVSFGQMDVIMTGDAEKEVEEEIINSGENIDAEILKLGHHGSDTSTSKEFLYSVSPEYALISCKVGNKYKHPSKDTMEKLETLGTKVYRTDENGTVKVVITSDSATFDSETGDYLCGSSLEEREATK